MTTKPQNALAILKKNLDLLELKELAVLIEEYVQAEFIESLGQ